MAQPTQRQFQLAWYQAWINNGDQNARMLLVESLMGQVRKAASKLRWGGDQADLESEGRLAILEAIEKYDPARGPISACAYYQIRERLLELTRTSGHAAVAARSRPERALRYHLARRMAAAEGEGLSAGEALHRAAGELRVSVEHAAAALAVRSSISTCRLAKYDQDDNDGGLDLASEDPTVEEHLDRSRVAQILTDAFAGLDDRERHILTSRMLADRPISLDALGEQYGVSREKIGQIYDEAVRHVRFELERRRLTLSDLI
jgi:RNA polymerase sigma-32 factor